MNTKRALKFGIAGAIVILGVLLFQDGRMIRRWAVKIHVRKNQLEFYAQTVKDDLALKKRERDEAKFVEGIENGKIIAIKCPIASVSTGDWMRNVERPICAFARTNHIEILRFRAWPNTNTEVCVWKKEADRMRGFVDSLTN
jgi:hypothetical protein